MTSNYTVAVLGLGAMGLPMATRLATQLTVHGFDIGTAVEAPPPTPGSAPSLRRVKPPKAPTPCSLPSATANNSTTSSSARAALPRCCKPGAVADPRQRRGTVNRPAPLPAWPIRRRTRSIVPLSGGPSVPAKATS